MRAAVELRGVAALQCGILDNRRSAKDKVELLPQHPGSELFVANRFLWRLCTAYSIPRQEITHLHYHQH
jgi:hypothetical protein